MVRKTLLFTALLAAAVFVLPHSAAAAIVGIPGLDVDVQDSIPASVGTAVTDANGWFSVTVNAAGDYTLFVDDPDLLSSLAASLDFTVPPEKLTPTAILWARVAFDDGLAASLIILADVIGEDEIGQYTIKMKNKWNSNYSHSKGKIKVDIRGMMADAVTNVTLSSSEGFIEADSIKYDSSGRKIKAEFTKETAYQALIPATSVRGDMIDVTITVDTIAGEQVEVVTVKIQGKK